MNRLTTQLIPALLISILSASAVGYQDDGFDEDAVLGPMYTEINFPGGPLSEYIKVLEESFVSNTSYMILPPAGDFEVPPINGLLSEPGAALDVIADISMDLTYPNDRVYPTTISWDYIDDYLLRIKPVKGRTSRPVEDPFTQGGTTTQVYELSQLTGNALFTGYTMENILGTMQVGFEMSGSGSPVIRFHEPTSVLFVKGDWKQLEILDGVLKALRSASERLEMTEERDAETERQVQKAQSESRELLRTVAALEAEVRVARDDSAELGHYLRGELGKLEIERDRLEAQVRNLEEVLQMFGPLEASFAKYATFKKQAEKNANPE